MPPTSL